jgi:hypothetical protein
MLMSRFLFIAVLLAVVAVPNVARSQLIQPLPRTFDVAERPVATFWGQGRVQSGQDPFSDPLQSLSGKVAATVNLYPRLLVYLAGNKGVGLETVKHDSFSMSSVAFPEAGNSAFLFKAEYALPMNRDPNERREIPIFLDWAVQQRTVQMKDESGNNITPSFTTNTFYLGTGYIYTLADSENPFRATFAAALEQLTVTDGSVQDYRTIGEDPSLPDVLRGFSVKAALQYNDFGFEFGYSKLRGKDGAEVPHLTGGLFHIAFTATGRLFDIRRPVDSASQGAASNP